MESEFLEQGIGGFRGTDVLGGEEAGEAALPVEVLSLDLALGLWGSSVAKADAIEVEGGTELGEGVGTLGKEDAVAVDVEFERQAVFAKSRREEVEIGQKVFAVEDARAGGKPGAVVEQIEEGILTTMMMSEPSMGRGIELPESAHLEALPPAGGGGRSR